MKALASIKHYENASGKEQEFAPDTCLGKQGASCKLVSVLASSSLQWRGFSPRSHVHWLMPALPGRMTGPRFGHAVRNAPVMVPVAVATLQAASGRSDYDDGGGS